MLFLLNEYYLKNNNFSFHYGDVRDFEKMRAVTFGADIILHCAALKHVFFYEYQPFEAVQTNIMGVKNIVEAAIDSKLVNENAITFLGDIPHAQIIRL